MLSQSGGIGLTGGAFVGGASSGNILIKESDASLIDIGSGSINAGASALTFSLSGGSANDNNNTITGGALRLAAAQ